MGGRRRDDWAAAESARDDWDRSWHASIQPFDSGPACMRETGVSSGGGW